jgi:hypothetical protein
MQEKNPLAISFTQRYVMRNLQHLCSKHRVGAATAVCTQESNPGTPEDLLAATVDALNDMANIVSRQCHTHPDTLTQSTITTYALALIRLRECASAAGFARLMNACDALAVTVSRLIDDPDGVNREKCAALKRFIVHAQAMIQISGDSAQRQTLPNPDFRTLQTA